MKTLIRFKFSPDTNIFKEGIYNLTDLGAFLENSLYEAQNVSQNKIANVLIFDEDYTLIQSIKLNPNCPKYTLASLKSTYKVVIIGDGDVYISKKQE
ncbi:hypothetical protein [Clostridium sp. BL-8]|uniref:hypothetical protein n=1 Tax=Clostridium sp. BL-8 TaxID=349938 RepID=UPI00098C3D81|nr:hypothetical protein [Clostridium sp. BL-8]OOM68609.1 hypothetical protein CLOBL_53230 [Clostridium sp. BL-8]